MDWLPRYAAAPLLLCLTCVAAPAWATPLDPDETPVPPSVEEPEDSPEDEDYEALIDSLEGLGREAQREALQEYLEQNPQTPYKNDIAARLEALDRPAPAVVVRRAEGLAEPLSFWSPAPRQRLIGRLSIGAPGWAQGLVTYDHPVKPALTIGGTVGADEGVALVEAAARYTLVRGPKRDDLLSGGLALRFELGDDTRIQLEPRLGYGRRLGPVEVQGSFHPRLRLTGLRHGLELRYQAGLGVGWQAAERWWVGVETSGYIKRIDAIRTDLDEQAPTRVSFFAVTGGTGYQVLPDLAVTAAVSIPWWYTFRDDYQFAVTAGVEYRPGRRP